MKRLIVRSVVALLLMSGPAAAACLYQGVLYSEGARVCMHRTMFVCRGHMWVKTAERCWERYSAQARPLPDTGQRPSRTLVEAKISVITCDAGAAGREV